MNLSLPHTRFLPVFLLPILLLVGCKTAPPLSTAPQTGYEFTVHAGDAVEDIAQAYREKGVDVTAKQILAVNPNLKFTTGFRNGLRCHIPETGVKLFVPALIKTVEEAGNIASRLMQPLEFASFTVSDIHSQEGASKLMSEKIKVGSADADAYQFMTTNWDAKRIQVETVNEYEAALKAGYYPYNTFEITMESFFKTADATLNFMKQAQLSSHSNLNKDYLTQLPVTFLNWTGDEKENLKNDAANGMTIKDYTKPNSRRHIHDLKIDGNGMTFCEDDMVYSVTELARGDVDSDGNEDCLIVIGTYMKSGSGRSYQTYVVSKTDPKQRQLKLVELRAGK